MICALLSVSKHQALDAFLTFFSNPLVEMPACSLSISKSKIVALARLDSYDATGKE
jgi:hypothetical protein